MQPLLTVTDVAAILGLSDWQVREYVRADVLPAIRVGKLIRFDPARLEAWLTAGGQALPGGHKWEPSRPRLRSMR